MRLRISPTTMPQGCTRPGDRPATRRPSASRSCSVNSPTGWPASGPLSPCAGASSLTISAGCSIPRRRAAITRRAPSSSGRSGCVGGSSISTTTSRPAGAKRRSTRSRTVEPRRRFPRTISISTPRPAVWGARRSTSARMSAGRRSITGHTCRRIRFQTSRRLGLRRAWKRRMPSSASTSMSSNSGSAVIRPLSSRTGVRSRTSASANSRSSFGLERPVPWKR